MLKRLLLPISACAALILAATDRAPADDFEQSLLKKFQRQNQKNNLFVKDDVEQNLLKVTAMAPTEPERALDLLRQTREMLDAADTLSKADREALARKLDDGFRDVKARLESKQERARVAPDPPTQQQVVLVPNNVPIPSTFRGAVTPIVSPDRRWVRIGFNGSFRGLTGLFGMPVPINVPTILQGPGKGVTVLP